MTDVSFDEALAEKTLSVEIVPATEEAAQQVMLWRNDPDTLANSVNSVAKVWPKFYSEFVEQYFVDAALPCLFLLFNGRRVAFVRFRRLAHLIEQQRACDISLMVAPEERGKRLVTRQVLERCLQFPRKACVDVVAADIKPTNTASIRLFERAGFVYSCDIDQPVPQENKTMRFKRFLRYTRELPLEQD